MVDVTSDVGALGALNMGELGELLMKKWASRVDGLPAPVARATAFVLQNQETQFKRLGRDGTEAIKAALGSDFEERVYTAIANALPRSVAFKLVSVQAMPAPVSGFAHFRRRFPLEATTVPETTFDIDIKAVMADAEEGDNISKRTLDRIKAARGTSAEQACFDAIFAGLIRDADRSIMRAIMGAVRPGLGVERDDADGVILAIERESQKIHMRTARGPATWIALSDIHLPTLKAAGFVRTAESENIHVAGTLKDKWIVVIDPDMDRELVVLGRQGEFDLDTGCVWGPYVFHLIDRDGVIGVRVRQAREVVEPGYYAAVRLRRD